MLYYLRINIKIRMVGIKFIIRVVKKWSLIVKISDLLNLCLKEDLLLYFG